MEGPLRYIETDSMRVVVLRKDPYTITERDTFIVDGSKELNLGQMKHLHFTLPIVDKKLNEFMKQYNERLI